MRDWNAVCDRCGFQYKSYELFREWTGHLVCRKCVDPREFEPRIKPERNIVAYPEPPGTDLSTKSVVCSPIFQCSFDADSTADVSPLEIGTASLGDTEVVTDSNYLTIVGMTAPSGYDNCTWSVGSDYSSYVSQTWTLEFYMNASIGGNGYADRGIFFLSGNNTDMRLFIHSNLIGFTPLQILYRNGVLFSGFESGTQWTLNEWRHFAAVMDFDNNLVDIYFHGTRVVQNTGNLECTLPNASGAINWGSAASDGDGDILIDDMRISPCRVYSGESFTPPARGSLPVLS
jgi:hypothetical protein